MERLRFSGLTLKPPHRQQQRIYGLGGDDDLIIEGRLQPGEATLTEIIAPFDLWRAFLARNAGIPAQGLKQEATLTFTNAKGENTEIRCADVMITSVSYDRRIETDLVAIGSLTFYYRNPE